MIQVADGSKKSFTFNTWQNRYDPEVKEQKLVRAGGILTEDLTDDSSSRKWIHISLVLIAILALNSLFFAYNYVNTQWQLSNLQSQISVQQGQIQSQQNQIQELLQKIEILQYINGSSQPAFPKIYDLLKQSVVLIISETGLGSGFVIDKEGHIVSNYHVIEGAENIEVTFMDGTIIKASIVGTDAYSDLAVIKVEASPETLHPVVLGTSSELTVGEPIAAIGNPFGLSGSITAGIVSQVGRELSALGGYSIIDVIQVDAAINPGNSGGPLVDMNGSVVGVNTAIISDSGTSSGVGFAIPSDTVKRELPFLLETGEYKHPWIGISGQDVTTDIAEELGLPKVQGFLILEVRTDSPAARHGLKVDDVIVEVDDNEVVKSGDLLVYLERNKRPGDWVTLTVIRNGEKTQIELELGERKAP